ncbi:DHS-like NAD/FAD-binding domain containing protein [Rhypophila decipiens]
MTLGALESHPGFLTDPLSLTTSRRSPLSRCKMITHVHPNDYHHLQTIPNLLGTASNIVTLAGAGISTNAGIPDFRSNNSAYSRGGRRLFHSSVLIDAESRHVFYENMVEMRQFAMNADPTKTHRFIRKLRDVGKLVRHYTQNMDCLEEKAGLSTDVRKGLESAECVLLHGSLYHFRCSNCPTTFRQVEGNREMESALDPESPCPACTKISDNRKARGKRGTAIGKLRPDIVLYDELDPRAESISAIARHDQSLHLDVFLIMGTSLATYGVKLLIRDFAEVIHKRRIGKVVFVNLTKPAKSWDNVIDYWVEWDCDAWVGDLMERQPALDPSAAIFGVPLHLPLLENAQDPSRGGAGTSADDAILISSDESDDDLDEGRSDTSFESLDGLLQNTRNKLKSGRVTSTSRGVDAGSDDRDTPEPSVSSNAGTENRSPPSLVAMHTEQNRPVPASPTSHRALGCAGASCRQCDGCAMHSNLSAVYRRHHQSQESQGEVSLDEWEAEGILGEEFYDGEPHYWVRWKATLEPESNLINMGKLLAKWKVMNAKMERRSSAAGITKRQGRPRGIPLE